jgi:hypothetical protein
MRRRRRHTQPLSHAKPHARTNPSIAAARSRTGTGARPGTSIAVVGRRAQH